MVLNDEAKSVELTYAGETVEVTETAAEFYNERQKAEVSLSKILGKDETFGIGNNPLCAVRTLCGRGNDRGGRLGYPDRRSA